MKVCATCGVEKGLDQFTSSKTTVDGFTTKCRSCVSDYNKAYREKNKESRSDYTKQYYADNREKLKKQSREWNKSNPERRKNTASVYYESIKQQGKIKEYYGNIDCERVRVRAKLWREMNRGKVNAQIAKRRADTKQATPKWAEFGEMANVYIEARRLTEETGIPHQVDHQVPINGKDVCGLHCLANLQILTAEENNRKKCKYEK